MKGFISLVAALSVALPLSAQSSGHNWVKVTICSCTFPVCRSRGVAYMTHDAYGNPAAVFFTNGGMTRYSYDAAGAKLRAEYRAAAASS